MVRPLASPRRYKRIATSAGLPGWRRCPAPVLDLRLDAAERKRVLAAKMRELAERRSQKKKRAR